MPKQSLESEVSDKLNKALAKVGGLRGLRRRLQPAKPSSYIKSFLYKPRPLPVTPKQKRNAEGQIALFEDNPIDHLDKK